MAVKHEVEYEVVEITRYRLIRKYKAEGPAGWSMGASVAADREYGEFDSRQQAERVAESLERMEMSDIQK